MRVCPECGHEDHPMWRPRPSRGFCDYTKANTLEYNDPELFAKIKEARPDFYNDGHFIYNLTKTGVNVERIEKSLFDFMGWGRERMEKVDHSLLAMVPPLTEYMKGDKIARAEA